MTHIDPDDLIVIALNGDNHADVLSAAERAHLADCAACTSEWTDLRRTVSAGRLDTASELLFPAASVWAGIHQELGLSAGLAATPSVAPDQTPDNAAVVRSIVSIVPRRRAWIPLAAAALIGIATGVAGTIAWPESTTSVLAQTLLSPLPGWDFDGEAVLTEDSEGRRNMSVSLTSGVLGETDASAGLHEVWLLAADASRLVSLGQLDGDSGVFPVPAGLNLDDYPLVDISAEPMDGDPAHSGDSIARGELHSP
jgi:hypothetical protein